MTLLKLRPYQANAVAAIRHHALQGTRRIALAAPTGSGKTLIAAHIVHSGRTNFNARILFIAPWIQLINQTVSALAEHGIHEVGVIRAQDPRTNPLMPVQVASVQTLIRREFPQADIVIIDECHMANSPMYEPIFEHYREAVIIGLSATPCDLKGVFEVIEPAATYAELIADGFIAEPKSFDAGTPNLRDVRTTGGDYAAGELELAMMQGSLMGDIVDQWKRLGRGHRTVVFASGIKHSKEIVARFNAAGIVAEHIDGDTPDEDRFACLRRLEDGHTRIVSNVGVLTTGWNQPSVRCCVLARPTKSLKLYKQMVGRVLRVHGDGEPIVIDHGGCINMHGLPHEDVEWTLTEAKRPNRSNIKPCPKCFAFIEATLKECPFCDFVFPLPKPREMPTEVAVALVTAHPPEEKRRFYDAQVALARSRGFKPGFPSFKFKEKYGTWPQWSWSTETKNVYAQDPTWQDKQMRREREAEHWKQVNAQKSEPMEQSVEEQDQSDLASFIESWPA